MTLNLTQVRNGFQKSEAGFPHHSYPTCRKFHRKVCGFVSRGPFLTSPLAPRGEICPVRVKFTPPFTPRGEHAYCLAEWRGKQRISPPGDNFTPRGQIHPWGTTSPRGVKVYPYKEWASGVNFTKQFHT
jgi:hypothetical protein